MQQMPAEDQHLLKAHRVRLPTYLDATDREQDIAPHYGYTDCTDLETESNVHLYSTWIQPWHEALSTESLTKEVTRDRAFGHHNTTW